MTTGALTGLDPCVHCGFCLQACPTFVATGDEADGPRGRIVLIKAIERGQIALDDAEATAHLDRCLGCRACETTCPSGVSYGPALEEIRGRQSAVRPVPLLARLTLAVMAEPARLVKGRSRLSFTAGMLAATRMRVAGDGNSPSPSGEEETERPQAADDAVVFTGCVMDGLFSHVNDATGRVLAQNGYTLRTAPRQQCCGALHAHAGMLDEARGLARRNLEAFSDVPTALVAVNSAGCGAMLKDYGHLLHGDPLEREAQAFSSRVKDVSELLAAVGPQPGGPLELTVAYDPPCHLAHAQRVIDSPDKVLSAIPGLRRVWHADADHCCGGAGIYTLVQPELSQSVLQRKIDAINAVEPDVVVTGNPGCAMQLGAGLLAAGLPTPVVHPVELLDLSYQNAGRYQQAG